MKDFFINGIGEVPGLFSWSHLIYTGLSLVLIFVLVFFTRKQSNEKIIKYMKIISIAVLALEVLKIVWNLTLRTPETKSDPAVNDYVPLYFCSFFIYVSLIVGFVKNKESYIHKFSVLFLFYGGMSGGLAFVLLPTTTLNIFPLLQVLSIHSLIYHVLMVTCAIWSLRFFKPTFKDFKLYAIGVLIIEVVVLIINLIFKTNFMLLNKPFEIAPLEWIYEYVPFIFPVLMAVGQMLITYFAAFGISLVMNKFNLLNLQIQEESK